MGLIKEGNFLFIPCSLSHWVCFYNKNIFTYYWHNLKINKPKFIHSLVIYSLKIQRVLWQTVASPLTIPPFLLANRTLVFEGATSQAEHLLSPSSLQLQRARGYILAKRQNGSAREGWVLPLVPVLKRQDVWNYSSHPANVKCQV